MKRRSLISPRFAAVLGSLCLAMLLLSSSGCAWYEQLQNGPAFGGYDETGGSTMRGKNPDAKPSGFLYDKRSQQIEKNLGGF